MKKVYEPLNMIKNGRYAVLYGKLAPEIQQQILSRMTELIEEDKEYEDKGNYGNLHNIDFIRTKTLCQGGDWCDFCFVRHRKGEVWERTKSI